MKFDLEKNFTLIDDDKVSCEGKILLIHTPGFIWISPLGKLSHVHTVTQNLKKNEQIKK